VALKCSAVESSAKSVCGPRDEVLARPTLRRGSKTNIRSATLEFAHIEKWETGMVRPWAGL